jgi:hypothetical protein
LFVLPEHLCSARLTDAIPLLLRALGVVAKESAWTQGAWARDRKGTPVAIDDRRAVAWCLSSAVVLADAHLHGTPIAAARPLPVRSPERLVTALSLLALPMLWTYAEVHGDEFGLRTLRSPRVTKEASASEEAVDPTLVAAIVNDQDGLELEHVLDALAVTLFCVRDELDRRGVHWRKGLTGGR